MHAGTSVVISDEVSLIDIYTAHVLNIWSTCDLFLIAKHRGILITQQPSFIYLSFLICKPNKAAHIIHDIMVFKNKQGNSFYLPSFDMISLQSFLIYELSDFRFISKRFCIPGLSVRIIVIVP